MFGRFAVLAVALGGCAASVAEPAVTPLGPGPKHVTMGCIPDRRPWTCDIGTDGPGEVEYRFRGGPSHVLVFTEAGTKRVTSEGEVGGPLGVRGGPGTVEIRWKDVIE